jgi:hypothetical protein
MAKGREQHFVDHGYRIACAPALKQSPAPADLVFARPSAVMLQVRYCGPLPDIAARRLLSLASRSSTSELNAE